MSYLKFKADHLFTGIQFLPGNNVLILKDNGEFESIVDEKNAGDNIQQFTGIISPGFINCHCHLELSHMKKHVPEKTGLVDFVYKVVTERSFAEEEIFDAIEKAESEMMANGIVAAGDICNNPLTIPQKQKQKIHYYNFIEASGWLPSAAEIRFQRALSLFNEFNSQPATRDPQPVTSNLQPATDSQLPTPDSRLSIVPHAPYSVSKELWDLIILYFENKVVTIHNQETAFEDEFFLQGTGDLLRMYEMMKIDNTHHQPSGKSSIRSYFHYLSKASSVILVHNTFITEADIDFALSMRDGKQLAFCICANANLYIENVLPPVEMLVKKNCDLVLGTDSLASNHSLNLLDEMKTIRKSFPSVTLETMLRWATLNGAKALEMDNMLGSFETGKNPGVVLIDNIEGMQLNNNSTVRKIV